MSRFSRSVLSLLLSGLAMQASAADTLIRQARVFDGERIIGVRDVLIQDGKISRIDTSIPAPAGAVITEAAGKTLLPGLIDSHVHAFKDQELPLLFGVTAQIDLFAAQPALQAFNRQLKEKNTQLPDTYSAGMLATVKGGHGTEYGLPVETLSAPDQAQAWVDARIAEGSHFIKIVMESGGHEHVVPSLSRDTVKALISAAHKRNKLALVHISSIDDALFALENGADGLVHLFTTKQISDQQLTALVRAAKKHRAFVIPTFSVLNSIAGIKADAVLANPAWMRWLTPVQQQALQQTYGRKPQPELVAPARKAAAAFQKAGIPVLAGTDAGNNGTQFGISMHQELLELVEAGLTPVQALQAATSSPAKIFHLSDQGRIATGMVANLLLIDGQPDQKITDTQRITEVWKQGEPVSPLQQAQIKKVAAMQSNAIQLSAVTSLLQIKNNKVASPFGTGWMAASDKMMGGKSTARMQVQQDSEAGPVLQLQANIQPGFAYPWAGVSLMPGARPMQAANLEKASELRFKTRGDGQTYALAFGIEGSFIPVQIPFQTSQDWQEVRVRFADVAGLNMKLITMISWNAGGAAGERQFEIADIRLISE